ncbi:MAG TPA: hypothetical protein VD963_04475 [Phycisphaerales bacterium]|nr:hypothetical protein [Phycisphaerales bacterium]
MNWAVVIGVIAVILVGGSLVALWWWRLVDQAAPRKGERAGVAGARPAPRPTVGERDVVVIRRDQGAGG